MLVRRIFLTLTPVFPVAYGDLSCRTRLSCRKLQNFKCTSIFWFDLQVRWVLSESDVTFLWVVPSVARTEQLGSCQRSCSTCMDVAMTSGRAK